MKQKIREQLTVLATQLIEEEKSFKTASVKKLVSEVYEKLTVLEYLENQIGNASEVVSADKKETKENSLDSKSFREENWFTEPEPLPQPDNKDELVEPLIEKIKDLVAQMPEESMRIDELLDEMLPKNNAHETTKIQETPSQKFATNDLEEFANNFQQMPEFERKQTQLFPKAVEGKEASKTMTESRAKSLNDTINKGLNIGLNDRLAFIKHLFEGQAEDYTRVLSQINTMESYEDAQRFIKGQVKPDYNDWLNKEEYSERFMNIIEKRFN